MALRKVHRVAELHHVAKKVGPVTEALQNPGIFCLPDF
jgi:hypothetical protein